MQRAASISIKTNKESNYIIVAATGLYKAINKEVWATGFSSAIIIT